MKLIAIKDVTEVTCVAKPQFIYFKQEEDVDPHPCYTSVIMVCLYTGNLCAIYLK